MQIRQHFYLSFIISLLLLGFTAMAQPVPTTEFPFKMTVEQYVEKYAATAVEEMHRNRIPASITLAQGLLESGNGNSRLALVGNNHFGIKCKKDWEGETLKEDDDAPQECFRKYPTPIDSYRDHSEFLKKGQRYAFLFDLELTDYKSWAHGLKKAGYATNPKYAEILIGVIERNNLSRFDQLKPTAVEEKQIVAEKKQVIAQETKLIVNGVPAVVVKLGDSYTSIALDNDMRVWQIYKYNDLSKNSSINVGDTIFIKPKNYKANIESHIVQSGEMMQVISQRYAIKLSRLLSMNKMKEGDEPIAGEVIYLRSKRKDTPQLREAVAPKDSLMDNTVYADAQKNIETSQPQLPHNPYDMEAHGIKEQMAFIHIVQAGETLFAIAKRYNIQLEGVKELNKLKSDAIQVGMHLIINPNQPSININEESVIPGYHTVLQGETLYSIARLYRTTVEMLKTLNELQSDTIKIGEELVIIPKFEEKPAEQKVTDDAEGPVYYEVREGETLYAISRKFQTEIAELRKLNNMIDNTIHVGQKLRVR